jgi:hypothetical protein
MPRYQKQQDFKYLPVSTPPHAGLPPQRLLRHPGLPLPSSPPPPPCGSAMAARAGGGKCSAVSRTGRSTAAASPATTPCSDAVDPASTVWAAPSPPPFLHLLLLRRRLFIQAGAGRWPLLCRSRPLGYLGQIGLLGGLLPFLLAPLSDAFLQARRSSITTTGQIISKKKGNDSV